MSKRQDKLQGNRKEMPDVDATTEQSPEGLLLVTILATVPTKITEVAGDTKWRCLGSVIITDPSARCGQCEQAIEQFSNAAKFTDTSGKEGNVNTHNHPCTERFQCANPRISPLFPYEVELPTTLYSLLDENEGVADALEAKLPLTISGVSVNAMHHEPVTNLWINTVYVSNEVRAKLKAL